MYFSLHVKDPSFLSDINETLIFYRDLSKKYSNNKFNENQPSVSRVVAHRSTENGQTDNHDEANYRFMQFCNRD
jgi:hypothetical protein